MNRVALVVLLLSFPARAEEPQRDRFGDPLPPGAIARIGTVHAHANASSIRFSSDGRTIITTGAGAVRQWDAETGRVGRVIARPAHGDQVRQVISADGRIAATMFEDRLEVYDLEHDRPLHRVEMPKSNELRMLGISPDGKLVLLRPGKGEQTLAVRDGKVETWPRMQGEAADPVFSADGSFVALRSTGGSPEVVFRSTSPGAESHRFPWRGPIFAVAPDGSALAVGSGDPSVVRMRHVKSGLLVGETDFKLVGQVRAARFSEYGRFLAIATECEIGVWETGGGRLLWKAPGSAKALAFTLDSGRLAAIDEILRVLDVGTGKSVGGDFGSLPMYFWMPWPGNRFVVTAGGRPNVLHVWDWVTGRVRFTATYDGTPELVWLSSDGRLLHVFGTRRFRTWDIGTGKEVPAVEPNNPDDVGVRLGPRYPSPDGRYLNMLFATADQDEPKTKCVVVRWDVVAGKVAERWPVTLPEFVAAELTPDGTGIRATASATSPGWIFDARSGRPTSITPWLPQREGSMTWSRSVVAAAHGGYVVLQVLGYHETVIVDAASGQPLLQLPRPAPTNRRDQRSRSDESEPKAFSPDGRWLAVAGAAGIELWDIVEQRRVPFHPAHPTPDSPLKRPSHCEMLAFLSNEHLLAWYADGSALVWELPAAAHRPPGVRMTAVTWDELGSTEPLVALRAAWALKNDPRAGIELLRRLKPTAPADERLVAEPYADLASGRFAAREAAMRRLRELGSTAESFLAAAVATSDNLEQQRRVRRLLVEFRTGPPATANDRRAARAVQAAELIGGAEGRALLFDWAKGDAPAILTREAKAALVRQP